jgi:hypothetical protein
MKNQLFSVILVGALLSLGIVARPDGHTTLTPGELSLLTGANDQLRLQPEHHSDCTEFQNLQPPLIPLSVCIDSETSVDAQRAVIRMA